MKHVDIAEQSPVIISLCPGIRGIERGLERVFRSVRVAAYVEIEAFIVENLLAAMEAGLVDAAPVWSNLKTFNPGPFRNRINGIIGGYPCQPFSLAGNRGGITDPRHLWPFIYTITEIVRPEWCFFENVAGHLSMGFPEVYKGLRQLGYRVETGIYSAEEAGAPHQRDRLFILAIMEDSAFFGERRRDNADSQRNGCEDQAQGSVGSLGHTGRESSQGGGFTERLSKSEGWNEGPEVERIGSEMANASGRRCQPAISQQRHIRESDTKQSEMADTCNHGQDATQDGQSITSGETGDPSRPVELLQSSGLGSSRHNDRFPARQGDYQYDWEEPRTIGPINRLPSSIRQLWHHTRKDFEKIVGKEIWETTDHNLKAEIESGLEYTIDGYNFTEDLHRAIGNSVVEQTAEIAFRDLLRKHRG